MEYVVLGTSYQRDIIAYDMRLLSYFSKCQANSNSVLRSINKVLPCILTAGTYKFISLHRIRKLNAKDYIGTYTRYHMPMCRLLTFCDKVMNSIWAQITIQIPASAYSEANVTIIVTL